MLLNKLVLLFYRVLRRLHIWHHPSYPHNHEENETAVELHRDRIEQNHGFIENQSAYTDMRYGNQNVSFCGCEVIATYNALQILEAGTCDCHEFVNLLSMYEQDGIVCGGFFGTAPQAIADYFKKTDYEVQTVEHEEDYDSCGAEHDVLVFTMYNNRKRIRDMIHTVCITKDSAGFTMHNGGMEKKSFPSVSELIHAYNNGKAGGILLIGISKTGKEMEEK